MGQYHDPDTITSVGRKLIDVYPSKFDALSAQLKPGEKLVGLYQRIGMFKLAPYIPHAAELAEFEAQYDQGLLHREGFFAVKSD